MNMRGTTMSIEMAWASPPPGLPLKKGEEKRWRLPLKEGERKRDRLALKEGERKSRDFFGSPVWDGRSHVR